MKKKAVLGILAVQMAILGWLVGCANTNEKAEPQTASESNIDLNDDEQAEKGEFDFDKAANNIVLNGQNIALPFTLNELGDEYSLDFFETHEENGIQFDLSYLMYNSEKIAAVDQLADSNEDVRDRKIVAVSIAKIYSNSECAEIDGIKINEDFENISEFLGEPAKVYDLGDNEKVYTYCRDTGDYLRIDNENGKIDGITLHIGSLAQDE